MPGTTVVRVNRSTQAILKDLSSKTGESMQELVAKAVEALRRERILRETNEAYARLKSDPRTWKEFQREQKAWDVTLRDGLDKE